MSNLNDRKGSPRRQFDSKRDPVIVLLQVLIAIDPVLLLFLFAYTGDWFVLCCLFYVLRVATARGVIWA